MKAKELLYATFVVSMLAGCSSNENEIAPGNEDLHAVQLQGTITAATRVTYDDAGKGTFAVGDTIGLFAKDAEGTALSQNEKYTAKNTNADFTSESPFYYTSKNDVNFRAYYPYSPSATSTLPVKVADQVDYLHAKADNTAYNTETVQMVFNHVMTKLTLTVKAGTGVSSLDALTAITLKDIPSEGEFDLWEGTVSATKDKTDDYVISLEEEETEEETATKAEENEADDDEADDDEAESATTEVSAEALLLPVSSATNIAVIITHDGVDYTATLKAAKGLGAGTQYAYTLTIQRTGLIVSGSSIKDWDEGTLADGDDEADATIQPEDDTDSSDSSDSYNA
jgi:hypothetical protein